MIRVAFGLPRELPLPPRVCIAVWGAFLARPPEGPHSCGNSAGFNRTSADLTPAGDMCPANARLPRPGTPRN
jgi:hypothetical protein